MMATISPAAVGAVRASKTFNRLAALNASEHSRPSLDIQTLRLARRLPLAPHNVRSVVPLPFTGTQQ